MISKIVTKINFEHFVVSACSLCVAAASLLFYSVLVSSINVELMASFIFLTSIAAMVQVAFVPNSMLFVYSSIDEEHRNQNFFYAVLFEIAGMISGLTILFIASPLLKEIEVLVLSYLSFSLAASTAGIGYIRAKKQWIFYAIVFTFPSLMRLVFILIDQINGQVDRVLAEIIIYYFLVPEIIRYGLVTPLKFMCHLRMPNKRSAKIAFRTVFHNWVFDSGSAIVEVGDRILLSALLSPSLLVLYFFARKLGAAATVVLEPFYAISFKSFLNAEGSTRNSSSILKVLGSGYFISVNIAFLILTFLYLVFNFVGSIEKYIPSIVAQFPIVFAIILLIDTLIAANRWSRYLSLLDGKVLLLLGWRLLCLLLFVFTVYLWSATSETSGLILGFAIFAITELFFLIKRTKNINKNSRNAEIF